MARTHFLVTRPSSCPYIFYSVKRNSAHTENRGSSSQVEAEQVLKRLNQQFLQEHHHAAQLKKMDIDTIIVYIGNELSLWQESEGTYRRTSTALNPAANQKYDRLKQIAHIPVLICIILNELIIAPSLKDECLSKLSIMAHELNGLKPQLVKLFDIDDLKRQEHIIDSTLKVIKSSMHGDMEVAKLKVTYLSDIKEALTENNRRAAEAQMIELDKIITEWGLKSKSVLERSRVLIVGPHGPRKGRVDIQYYICLYETILGTSKVKDNKLYHVEMLPTQMTGIDVLNDLILNFLLGSELNKSIGVDIMNDSHAMFSDILKSHAPPILDSLLRF